MYRPIIPCIQLYVYCRGFQTMGCDATQTWVALALSFGREPLCDPQKIKINRLNIF